MAQVTDELDYDEFNDTRLMPFLTAVVCVPYLLIHFPFFCFALLHMMIFKWNTYVRLALLLVLLLTLLIYLGQSTPTVLMTSLGSMWWVATKMSWVTLFLWVHER